MLNIRNGDADTKNKDHLHVRAFTLNEILLCAHFQFKLLNFAVQSCR